MSGITHSTEQGVPGTPDREPGSGRAGLTGRPRWLLLAGVAVTVLILDQLTKWWAVAVLEDRTIDLVWTLRLRLVHNFGSAFSFAQGQGVLISVLAVVAVVILLRTGRRSSRPAPVVALGLIVGGAVGNLIDRAFRAGEGFLGGGVVDFIDLQWWPVFNVADMGVVCGAVLLVLTGWRDLPDGDGAGS